MMMNLLTLERLAKAHANEYTEARYTKQRFSNLSIDWAVRRFREKRL